MGWELHPAKDAFPAFAKAWDRLNAELYGGHPFFDSRFVGAALRYFSTGDARLCLYRQHDAIRGALILEPAGTGRWRTFRPAQMQATPLLTHDTAPIDELFDALPGLVWNIELYAVDPRYAPDLSTLRRPVIRLPQATTIGIDAGTCFETYWDDRPRNLKANMRRYRNRLEKECCAASHTILESEDDMATAVQRFGVLESAGWKGRAGTAIAPDNVQGAFYTDVMRAFARTGSAAIHELRLDGTLAASRLVIQNDRMAIILKTTYEESLSRFAPGRLQLQALIEHLLRSAPPRAIEFYTNATRDQKEWAGFECTLEDMSLFRDEFAADFYGILKTARRLVRGPRHRRSRHDATDPIRVCANAKFFRDNGYDLSTLRVEDDIDLSIDWFDRLHRQVYSNDPGVRYYFTATENKTVKTVLPVRFDIHGRTRHIHPLANYYTALYAPLSSPTSTCQELCAMLARATRDQKGAHVMRFSPMDPDSPAYGLLENALRSTGWIPFRFRCFGNWYLPVTGDWQAYLASRSANLRSAIKRRTRKFLADGGQLDVICGHDRLDEAISAFHEVYSASWKKPEPHPGFIPALIRDLAFAGRLRLGIASLAGKPIAAQLWIAPDRTASGSASTTKASIFKVAYHEDYANYSPGTVLTAHLLKHVIDIDQVREVDFLIGDDEYKRLWMSHRRERWGLVAYNPRTAIGLALLAREATARMARRAGRRINDVLARRPQIGGGGKDDGRMAPTPKGQSGSDMALEIVPASRFSDYARQWDALVRARPGTPFLESAFVLPALEVFGTGSEKLCLFRVNGKLRAAALMQRHPKGIWQTFQPSQLPLGAWIADETVDLKTICDELGRKLPGMTLSIGISQIDPRLQRRPEDGPAIRSLDYIRTAWVDIDRDFQTYWDERGKNLKQNTRKQRNKLAAEGVETRLERVTAPEGVAQAIEDYGRLESAGWKAADGTAIHPGNDQSRFYRKMLENFCAMGRGCIYRYWFGDKVAAMDLCIHDAEALVILKTAYDESFKCVSPATLMRQEEFQQLFAEKQFARIEFFGKVMEWHTRWTEKSRGLYHVTAYRWPWVKKIHTALSARISAHRA